MNATAMMRLADAPVLPFDFTRLTENVTKYLDEIVKLDTAKADKDKPSLDAVRKSNAKLAQAAVEYSKAFDHAQFASTPEKLQAIDELLIGSEHDLAPEPGLPGRPWYRNRIYSPGRYTGYAVKTLPGIREAVEAKQPAEANDQAKQVAQVLETLAARA